MRKNAGVKKPTQTKRRKLGRAIRAARVRKGMSLRELGERVGVGPVAILRYERGVNDPPGVRLLGIARVLGINLQQVSVAVHG